MYHPIPSAILIKQVMALDNKGTYSHLCIIFIFMELIQIAGLIGLTTHLEFCIKEELFLSLACAMSQMWLHVISSVFGYIDPIDMQIRPVPQNIKLYFMSPRMSRQYWIINCTFLQDWYIAQHMRKLSRVYQDPFPQMIIQPLMPSIGNGCN